MLKTQLWEKSQEIIETEYKISQDFNKTPDVLFTRITKKKKIKMEFLLNYIRGKNLQELRENLNQNKEIMSEETALKIVAGLLTQYNTEWFEKGYIHRDIKLENILHDPETGSTEFIDFGTAKKCASNETIACSTCSTTPVYHAPEITNKSFYSTKSDIFALGCILKEILFGYNYGTDQDGKIQCLCQYSPAKISQQIAKEILTHIELMIHTNPEERPSFEQTCSFFAEIFKKYNIDFDSTKKSNTETEEKSKESSRPTGTFFTSSTPQEPSSSIATSQLNKKS